MLQVLEAIYLGKATPSSGGGTSGADASLSNLTDAGKIKSAHLAMPSDVYDTITAAESAYYTAPADGYITFLVISNSDFLGKLATYIPSVTEGIYSETIVSYAFQSINVGQSATEKQVRAFLPVAKGQKFGYEMWKAPTSYTVTVKFFYAQGSESEKQSS